MSLFRSCQNSLEDIYRVIGQVPVGQVIISDFLKLEKKGMVEILPYPTEIYEKLNSEDSPIGAVFVTDGSKGTIYMDFQSELGIQVPFLFHELVHSLDQSLWNAPKLKLTNSEKYNLIFRAESLAFHLQHLLLETLKKIHPELIHYYQSRYAHISSLNRAINSQELRQYCDAVLSIHQD